MRHQPLFLILGLSLALVACDKTSKPDLTLSSDPAPTAPAVNCQPSILAPSIAEPAPPAGLTSEEFYAPLFDFIIDKLGEERGKAWIEWFTTTRPGWAREGWSRIDDARKLPPCDK